MDQDQLTVRAQILDQAKQVVTQDRNKQYQEPEDSFRAIAALWNEYLTIRATAAGGRLSITPVDVALMMSLLKVARLAGNPTHIDSWVDVAGYAACGAEAALLDQQRRAAETQSDADTE